MRARAILSLPVLLALAAPAPVHAELRLPSCQDLQELALSLPYREVLAPNVMSRQRVPAALFDRRIDERFGSFALRWTEADFERVIQHALNCRLAIRATTPDEQRRQQALDDLRQAAAETSWYIRSRNRELQESRTGIASFANASPPDVFRIVLLSHVASINDQSRWFQAINEIIREIDNTIRSGRYSHHHDFRHVVHPLSQNIAAADFPDVARLANELLDNHVTRFLRALNEDSQVPFVDPRSLRSLRDLEAFVDRMLPKSGAPEAVQRLREGINALIIARENEIVSHTERRLDALPNSWRTAASLRQPSGVQPSMASVRWPEGLPRPDDLSSLSNDAWARIARSFDQRAARMVADLAGQVSSRISQASDPQALLAVMQGAVTPEVPEDLRALPIGGQGEARCLAAAGARPDARASRPAAGDGCRAAGA
jgi:hypothetical protein